MTVEVSVAPTYDVGYQRVVVECECGVRRTYQAEDNWDYRFDPTECTCGDNHYVSFKNNTFLVRDHLLNQAYPKPTRSIEDELDELKGHYDSLSRAMVAMQATIDGMRNPVKHVEPSSGWKQMGDRTMRNGQAIDAKLPYWGVSKVTPSPSGATPRLSTMTSR